MFPKKDWDKAEGDQAFLSHSHTIEVLRDLPLDHPNLTISEARQMYTVNKSEYRNDFLVNGKPLSVTTIVYVDSSTYTYLHRPIETSILEAKTDSYCVLPNAVVTRSEGRQIRQKTIISSLEELELIGTPNKNQKKGKGGIIAYKDSDGVHTLDYSGLHQRKK